MKTKHVILLILALILASFFAGYMVTWKKRTAAYGQLAALTDSISYYRAEIGGLERQVWEKQQLVATKEEAIQAGILEQDRLKALNLRYATQVTKLQGELKAAIDSIPLPDTLFVTDTITEGSGEAKSYLMLPFSWEYSDQYINLRTGVRENRTGWFDLNAPITLDITLGGRKGQNVAAVTTPSPYVSITDFNVVNIQEQNILYRHKWIPWAAGYAGGVVTGWAIWGR